MIPSYIWGSSVGVMFICMMFGCLYKRRLALSDKHLWTIALAELYFLILCSTVFGRPISNSSRLELMPFWSYQAYLSGKDYILDQIVLNVLAFIPIGFLLGGILHGKGWWKFLTGIGMSLLIELLQYIRKCGVSEIDDIMHNTLGFMIGWGFYWTLHRFLQRKRTVA